MVVVVVVVVLLLLLLVLGLACWLCLAVRAACPLEPGFVATGRVQGIGGVGEEEEEEQGGTSGRAGG